MFLRILDILRVRISPQSPRVDKRAGPHMLTGVHALIRNFKMCEWQLYEGI